MVELATGFFIAKKGTMTKILRHPDKDEIIKRILDGETAISIENWIKEKYKNSASLKRLTLNKQVIAEFRQDYLNDIKDDAKDQLKIAQTKANNAHAKNKAATEASNAYQEKLAEIKDDIIDVPRRILELSTLIESRIEKYFNALDGKSLDSRNDRMFNELITQQRGIVADWEKFVNKSPTERIQHDVNINVVTEQVNVLKSIVYEVLQECDPKLVPLFVSKLNSRLMDVNYGTNDYDKHRDRKLIDVEVEDVS